MASTEVTEDYDLLWDHNKVGNNIKKSVTF